MPVNFYRRIPRTVRALQFVLTPTFKAELKEFARDEEILFADADPPHIVTGTGTAFPSDWIVQFGPLFLVVSDASFHGDFEPFPAPVPQVSPEVKEDLRRRLLQIAAFLQSLVNTTPCSETRRVQAAFMAYEAALKDAEVSR